MIKYRYARVQCLCGKVHDVPRYCGATTFKCGVSLRTESEWDDSGKPLEKPVAIAPDNYPVNGHEPVIVGWR